MRWRIENASRIFRKMSSLFYDNNLNLKLWQKLTKCYTWSVHIIWCKDLDSKACTTNRLAAFEMWLLRRMLGIPWKGLFTNDEVLR